MSSPETPDYLPSAAHRFADIVALELEPGVDPNTYVDPALRMAMTAGGQGDEEHPLIDLWEKAPKVETPKDGGPAPAMTQLPAPKNTEQRADLRRVPSEPWGLRALRKLGELGIGTGPTTA